MNKPFLLMLAATVSLSGVAAAEPGCAVPADTVKELSPQNPATVAHHFWETRRDRRSGEYLKTLHLFFKNGDHAVIQHKYCTVYNFEAAYFRTEQLDDLDTVGAGKILAGLYENYAARKPTFKRPLPDVISASLKERGFDGKKDLRIGLPVGNADYPNEHVDYSIRYNSLHWNNSIYSSVTTFYLGIGGLD